MNNRKEVKQKQGKLKEECNGIEYKKMHRKLRRQRLEKKWYQQQENMKNKNNNKTTVQQ